MATLKIPDRYREGIVKVAEISEMGFAQIREALNKAPACKDSTELSAWVADETSDISPTDRGSILAALAPMIRVQKNSTATPRKFVSDVWDSLKEYSPQLVQGISGETLKSRLSQLVEIEAFDLPSTKIGDVKGEVERNFCKVRILTDLRPAFRSDPTEPPYGMVAMHNLQLGYHDGNGTHHEFFVTLDAGDIKKLRAALDKAETKATTLRKMLSEAKIDLYE